MGDVLFYHLTETPLEATLPPLLEKSLERGWNVRLRTSSEARANFLDQQLWSYRQESFLPHGLAGSPHAATQPILITQGAENTNGPDILMLVDGAMEPIETFEEYARVCVFFDGSDADALAKTRTDWSAVKAAGLEAKYWAQDNGKWVQKA